MAQAYATGKKVGIGIDSESIIYSKESILFYDSIAKKTIRDTQESELTRPAGRP